MMLFLIWIAQLICIPLFSPLCVGVIRKMKARLQNRQGASIVQPYYDIWKLLHKDEVISADASWIFSATPYIVFTTTLVVGASIPVFTLLMPTVVTGDILAIAYLLALGTFFLALAGMDVGSAFGGFGSSREMTLAALTEGGLIFSLLALAVLSGHSNVFAISGAISTVDIQNILPISLAFMGFCIALLSETARFPFDNPATHLELTMIHEAMILEYSGKKLALLEWASANKLLIFITLGANLFLPWGMSHDISGAGTGFVIFAVKVLLFCGAIALLESSMSKLRFFKLPELLLASFILSSIAISLIK